MSTDVYAILVIGYSRHDFLEQLLNDLDYIENSRIFVSVDCDANGKIMPEIWQMQFHSFSKINWIFQEKKLGIGFHIPHAVNEILKDFQSVVVLEDDCRVAKEVVISTIEFLARGIPSNCLSIGFMSALPSSRFLEHIVGTNKWRITEYFSPWGWATTREAWQKYSNVIENGNLEVELEKSPTWKKKNSFSKKVWLRRFKVVADLPEFTWDYQMQYATFKHSGYHLMPFLRSVDNIGFNSKTATNTSERKPKWLQGNASKKKIVGQVPKSKIYNGALQWLDQLTWAGDSLFAFALRRIRLILLEKSK
jgi:hypothetical protein